ncbi:hypothetical protein BGZ99_006122 [Dissophora globulifera]|uniref:CsbD family protein n=1 Tax=Dissophora globulifera TaxID=979702 RepID=A0A9P6RDD2_9FUNG|nr:hypothetical protein BGZ99_006122 [Dissophora globulifera]
MAEKIANVYHSAMGATKETLGRAMGNEHLVASGAAEKAEAARAALVAQQRAQGKVDNAEGHATTATTTAGATTAGATTGDRPMEAEGHVQQASGDVNRIIN